MEEYVDILQSILTKKIIDTPPNYLDAYFDIIDKNGRLEIVNNNDVWNQAFGKIEDSYKIRKYQLIHNSNMVTSLVSMVSEIIAVQGKKKKIDLFPLISYLDQSNAFYQHLIDHKFFDDIESNVVEILNSINIKINMRNISNLHWESESFDNYEKGLKNKNIHQIYNFILAYERGNGLILNSYINFLVFVLYKISYKKLITILDGQEDSLTIIHLLDNLSTAEKIKVATSSNNMLLKFEVLRGVFYFNKATLNKDEKLLVANIIIEMSKDNDFWQQFLTFYLEFPSRSPQVFESLGLALNQLSDNKIKLFTNGIKIDKYINDDCKLALELCFSSIESKSIQNFIAENIFNRWIKFVNGYDEYMDTILITNVINITIHYASDFFDSSVIIDAIQLNVNKIKELDNEWFISELEQNNQFYKYMSILFVYGVSSKAKSLKQEKLIQDICDTSLILKKEHHHDQKTTKTMFSEFIFPRSHAGTIN